MPSKTVNTVIRVCEAARREGHELEISRPALEQIISKTGGGEHRAIKRLMLQMQQWGVVTEARDNIFQINWNEVYKLAGY